jgi:hypothetical protein
MLRINHYSYTCDFFTKKSIANFRSAAEIRGKCCSISGLGGEWARGIIVGPIMYTCYIVPLYAWDLYPLPEDDDNEEIHSTRRLQRKWEFKVLPNSGGLGSGAAGVRHGFFTVIFSRAFSSDTVRYCWLSAFCSFEHRLCAR